MATSGWTSVRGMELEDLLGGAPQGVELAAVARVEVDFDLTLPNREQVLGRRAALPADFDSLLHFISWCLLFC